ncbi:acrylyl-CoA reductase family protein [Bacillus sp. FJAT-45037]|uniref:acrylyl-CoA reductase family protein n=1 Tax=Bacillus sp. FJAT-45037 TaxID=2011007 RepID=UPI000C2502E3|nr:acryloyl-CoA reductase [Bacillus sp. FJAT-45037]
MNTFEAYMVDLVDGKTNLERKTIHSSDLGEGEVTIEVAYSSVNFKDGLATLPKQIIRNYPLIPGIDLSGTVIESTDDRFKKGDNVLATSYEIGVSHHGGFSELARVPADWVVPLPEGLSLKEAMVLGTAGFTAALSVQKLEDQGTTPADGPVLVTGATGGVGSVAVDILSKRGFDVHASTGKANEHNYLKELGASTILDRAELTPEDKKPMRREVYAAAVDPVGGETLAYVLSTLKYGGSVATSGLTGGHKVETTVYPFILRGINWLGVDSVYCPMELRKKIWDRLATDYKPNHLMKGIVNEITMDELPNTLSRILKGELRGRTIVKVK